MKTIIFFSFILLISVSSCNKSEEVPNGHENFSIEANELEKDIQLDSFFLSVDSLNKDYTAHTTRFNIKKWGSRFLSAVVDGCVGAVASAATTPIGGTIIGTGASWAYDEYLNNILDKAEKRTSQNFNSQIPTAILANDKESMTFVDSVGYYHNKILADISNSGKSYIDKEGNINIEELFTDISMRMNQYQVEKEKIIDKDKQTAFSSSIKTFIKNLDPNDDASFEKSFSGFESEKFVLELSEKELSDVKQMCNKVSKVIPYLENETAVEYGENLYEIIEVSNLSQKQKQNFKILDNIFVNSKLYWDEVNK